MPFPIVYRPSRVTPTAASQVEVLNRYNAPADLTTAVAVSSGTITFTLADPGIYMLRIRVGGSLEYGTFGVDGTSTDPTAPEWLEHGLIKDRTAIVNPVDARILANLADPASALNTTFAPAQRSVYGPRWVFDGDSITANGITTSNGNQDRSRSWTSEMARLSMGRIKYVYNAAVSGYRIDQMLARFDEFVAPKDPDVVLLTAGTNDIGQGRSMDLWLADLESYRVKCQSIGATLIVGAIWPSDSNTPAGRQAATRTWNTALYSWAESKGVQVIPWDTLADPVTGGWPTGWSADQVHPGLLDSYTVIGKLGWQSVEPKAGPALIRRATYNGADALPNGLFTTLNAATNPPNLTAGTSSTASGTLAAGTYSYRYTARTFWGESLPSTERQVTLSGTGQITITNSTVSGARGYRVYRKAPGDTTWKYLTYLSPGTTTSFTDNGSLTAGADMSGVDTSQTPTGLVAGSTTPHQIGPVTTTEAGIKGRIFRSMPYEGSVSSPNDHFLVNVTPGEVYEVSALIRTTGTTEGVLILRFRDASATIAQMYIARDRMTNGWGLAHAIATVPPNVSSVRISLDQTDGSSTGYAEMQFRKIS